jgi:hypothetical protein
MPAAKRTLRIAPAHRRRPQAFPRSGFANVPLHTEAICRSMTTPSEFRNFAAACTRLSQSAENPANKTALLSMAEKWNGVATQADRIRQLVREADSAFGAPAADDDRPRQQLRPLKKIELRAKVDAEPALKPEPLKAEPLLKAELLTPEPLKADPLKADALKLEPPKTEPPKMEPPKVERLKPEPLKLESPRAEPMKPEPSKAESLKPEPAKTESLRPEPLKPEPLKAEAAKTEPSRPESSNVTTMPRPEPLKGPVLRKPEPMPMKSDAMPRVAPPPSVATPPAGEPRPAQRLVAGAA